MKIVETKESLSLAPVPCSECGGIMRLIGSEPHPSEAETDLLTFSCTACGKLHVTPLTMPSLTR